jgi:hypothetical protein
MLTELMLDMLKVNYADLLLSYFYNDARCLFISANINALIDKLNVLALPFWTKASARV